MKRLFVLFFVICVLLSVGCNTVIHNEQAGNADFRFYSLEWGTDWETAQKNDNLENVKYEINENEQRQTVILKDLEYLGVKLDMIAMAFDIDEKNQIKGLNSVVIQYAEENEETLLTELTKLYGDPKTTYTDKNGVENPIAPMGWVSSDTIEDVLTEQEKEYCLSLLPKEYEQNRIDAFLRSPLVLLKFDKNNNMIEFNGNNASFILYIKAQLKK